MELVSVIYVLMYKFSRIKFLEIKLNIFVGDIIAVAGLVTLQNLQNLASLQGLPQVASIAAGLSNITNLAQNITSMATSQPPPVNAPLNLSVSASGM